MALSHFAALPFPVAMMMNYVLGFFSFGFGGMWPERQLQHMGSGSVLLIQDDPRQAGHLGFSLGFVGSMFPTAGLGEGDRISGTLAGGTVQLPQTANST